MATLPHEHTQNPQGGDSLIGIQAGDTMFIRCRVPVALWQRLNIARINRRTTIQQLMRDAIVRHLDEEEAANAG